MHKQRGRGRSRALAAALTALVAFALVIAGCGSSDSSDSSTSGGGGSASTAKDSLSVEISTTATDILNYVAETEGFFRDEGVDVDVHGNAGTNAITLVSSGQSDIAGYGGSTPLVVAAQGKPTSILYGISGGGVGAVMVGDGRTVKTLDDLRDVSDCRIGAFPEGSSSYGYTAVYIRNLGLDCDIVPFQDQGALTGALAAGRLNAMVSGWPNMASSVREKHLPILIDTRDPAQRARYAGREIVEVTFWSTRDTAQKKRDAIVRWLRAINRARAFVLDRANEDEIANKLSQLDDFSGFTPDQIKSDVIETFQAYLPAGNENGYITPSTWDDSLSSYGTWRIPRFDASAASNQYDEAIDFGPYDAAIGRPRG